MADIRILIVDDEPSLRMTLAANLELEGYVTFEASNGKEALEFLRESEVDLVLSDIRMPQMTGVELFQSMREKKIAVPVIMMTAFTVEEQVDQVLSDGAFTVLYKPFDVAHAIRTVTSAARRPAVLIVDDAPQVLESTVEALRLVGLSACAADNYASAIQAVREGSIDVCVVDLVMPGRSGAELAEELRSVDPDMQVIAISGHDLPEMVRRIFAAGAYTFLHKPIDPGELIRSIATARGMPR